MVLAVHYIFQCSDKDWKGEHNLDIKYPLRGEHNVKKIIVLIAKSTPPLMLDVL